MSMHKRRAQFYHTLATLEDAGVPRVRALQQQFPAPFGRAARQMADMISVEGVQFEAAMGQMEPLFSPFERGLVKVGETTGRLETVFRSLAEWFQLMDTLRSQMISGLIYPALVYHVAAVLIPGIALITGSASVSQTLMRIVLLLAIPYVAAFVLLVLLPRLSRRGPGLAVIGALTLRTPVLGTLVYKLNYSRFFHAYGIALRSGVGAPQAAELAAAGCSNPWIRRRLDGIVETVRSQACTFTEAFRQRMTRRDRNSMIVAMMDTGELSGAPDQMALKIAGVYREEAEEALKRVTTIAPVVVYLVLAMCIGYHIIKFYQGMADQIRELL